MDQILHFIDSIIVKYNEKEDKKYFKLMSKDQEQLF